MKNTTEIGVTLIEKPLGEAKGYYDPPTGEIVINSEIPKVGKGIALVHELIHCAETAMLNEGIIKKRFPHEAMGSLAHNLLLLLVALGKWKGLNWEDMLEFYANEESQLSQPNKEEDGTD